MDKEIVQNPNVINNNLNKFNNSDKDLSVEAICLEYKESIQVALLTIKQRLKHTLQENFGNLKKLCDKIESHTDQIERNGVIWPKAKSKQFLLDEKIHVFGNLKSTITQNTSQILKKVEQIEMYHKKLLENLIQNCNSGTESEQNSGDNSNEIITSLANNNSNNCVTVTPGGDDINLNSNKENKSKITFIFEESDQNTTTISSNVSENNDSIEINIEYNSSTNNFEDSNDSIKTRQETIPYVEDQSPVVDQKIQKEMRNINLLHCDGIENTPEELKPKPSTKSNQKKETSQKPEQVSELLPVIIGHPFKGLLTKLKPKRKPSKIPRAKKRIVEPPSQHLDEENPDLLPVSPPPQPTEISASPLLRQETPQAPPPPQSIEISSSSLSPLVKEDSQILSQTKFKLDVTPVEKISNSNTATTEDEEVDEHKHKFPDNQQTQIIPPKLKRKHEIIDTRAEKPNNVNELQRGQPISNIRDDCTNNKKIHSDLALIKNGTQSPHNSISSLSKCSSATIRIPSNNPVQKEQYPPDIHRRKAFENLHKRMVDQLQASDSLEGFLRAMRRKPDPAAPICSNKYKRFFQRFNKPIGGSMKDSTSHAELEKKYADSLLFFQKMHNKTTDKFIRHPPNSNMISATSAKDQEIKRRESNVRGKLSMPDTVGGGNFNCPVLNLWDQDNSAQQLMHTQEKMRRMRADLARVKLKCYDILDDIQYKDVEPIKSEYPRKDICKDDDKNVQKPKKTTIKPAQTNEEKSEAFYLRLLQHANDGIWHNLLKAEVVTTEYDKKSELKIDLLAKSHRLENYKTREMKDLLTFLTEPHRSFYRQPKNMIVMPVQVCYDNYPNGDLQILGKQLEKMKTINEKMCHLRHTFGTRMINTNENYNPYQSNYNQQSFQLEGTNYNQQSFQLEGTSSNDPYMNFQSVYNEPNQQIFAVSPPHHQGMMILNAATIMQSYSKPKTQLSNKKLPVNENILDEYFEQIENPNNDKSKPSKNERIETIEVIHFQPKKIEPMECCISESRSLKLCSSKHHHRHLKHHRNNYTDSRTKINDSCCSPSILPHKQLKAKKVPAKEEIKNIITAQEAKKIKSKLLERNHSEIVNAASSHIEQTTSISTLYTSTSKIEISKNRKKPTQNDSKSVKPFVKIEQEMSNAKKGVEMINLLKQIGGEIKLPKINEEVEDNNNVSSKHNRKKNSSKQTNNSNVQQEASAVIPPLDLSIIQQTKRKNGGTNGSNSHASTNRSQRTTKISPLNQSKKAAKVAPPTDSKKVEKKKGATPTVPITDIEESEKLLGQVDEVIRKIDSIYMKFSDYKAKRDSKTETNSEPTLNETIANDKIEIKQEVVELKNIEIEKEIIEKNTEPDVTKDIIKAKIEETIQQIEEINVGKSEIFVPTKEIKCNNQQEKEKREEERNETTNKKHRIKRKQNDESNNQNQLEIMPKINNSISITDQLVSLLDGIRTIIAPQLRIHIQRFVPHSFEVSRIYHLAKIEYPTSTIKLLDEKIDWEEQQQHQNEDYPLLHVEQEETFTDIKLDSSDDDESGGAGGGSNVLTNAILLSDSSCCETPTQRWNCLRHEFALKTFYALFFSTLIGCLSFDFVR